MTDDFNFAERDRIASQLVRNITELGSPARAEFPLTVDGEEWVVTVARKQESEILRTATIKPIPEVAESDKPDKIYIDGGYEAEMETVCTESAAEPNETIDMCDKHSVRFTKSETKCFVCWHFAADQLEAVPVSQPSERYCPNPFIGYNCVYCNVSCKLIDAGIVVDSYQNVCHEACLVKVRPDFKRFKDAS
jgi:hypothetical protein